MSVGIIRERKIATRRIYGIYVFDETMVRPQQNGTLSRATVVKAMERFSWCTQNQRLYHLRDLLALSPHSAHPRTVLSLKLGFDGCESTKCGRDCAEDLDCGVVVEEEQQRPAHA